MIRRLCNTKMKTIKKKFLKILIISSVAFIYNEFLVYYLVLVQCDYPPVTDSSSQTSVMVLADTHLLGSRLGHWADKLRREWQMYSKTWKTRTQSLGTFSVSEIELKNTIWGPCFGLN